MAEAHRGRSVWPGPEDLPSLVSVVEADRMTIGDREPEFRVLQPAGPPKWLRLRGRLVHGGEGRPDRLVGSVADASTLRSDITDVARIQRLAAALATTVTVRDVGKAVVAAPRRPHRAGRVAFAELENERLVVTVLDPPEPEAWPELWRAEWPDASVRTMPALAAAPREGRARIWPTGSLPEPAPELVTNALVPTEGQVRLDITLVNDRLRLAVAASRSDPPSGARRDDRRPTGPPGRSRRGAAPGARHRIVCRSCDCS